MESLRSISSLKKIEYILSTFDIVMLEFLFRLDWTLAARSGAYMKLHCQSFFFDQIGHFSGQRLD